MVAMSQAWTTLEHVVAGLPLFDRCSDHVCKRCCICQDDSKGGDRGEGGRLTSVPAHLLALGRALIAQTWVLTQLAVPDLPAGL